MDACMGEQGRHIVVATLAIRPVTIGSTLHTHNGSARALLPTNPPSPPISKLAQAFHNKWCKTCPSSDSAHTSWVFMSCGSRGYHIGIGHAIDPGVTWGWWTMRRIFCLSVRLRHTLGVAQTMLNCPYNRVWVTCSAIRTAAYLHDT